MPESWFAPTGGNHARMLLWLAGGLYLAQLAGNFREQWRFFRTVPARVYGPPPRLLGRWRMPGLTEPQFLLSGLGLAAALGGALLGWQPQGCLLVAVACHLLYFSQINWLSYVRSKPNLLVLVLLTLAAAPGLDAPLAQPAPLWPVILVKLALAQMYFSAGLQKLRHVGWAWADGGALRAALVRQALWTDQAAAWRLAARPQWCRWLSTAVLAWELTFWVIVWVPWLTPLYVTGGVLFHLGTTLTMRIEYWKYLSPVYLVFLTEPALRVLTHYVP